MKTPLKQAQKELDERKKTDTRIEIYTAHPAPEGKLARGHRGWLNHRIDYWIHFRAPWSDHVIVQAICGGVFFKALLIDETNVESVCGRCEREAERLGLPALDLIPEGGCEAIYSRHQGKSAAPKPDLNA